MKKIITILAILYVAVAGYSLYGRMSYTNELEDPGEDTFQVAMLGDYADDNFFQDYEKKLEDAAVVLKVKATGERVYEAKSIGQGAVVEQVFRGDETLVGEKILLVGNYRLFFLEQDNGEILHAMNMGFVNYMQEGHEYLIFLQGQVESLGMGVMYQLVPGIISSIFDYEKHDHVIPTDIKENNGIMYSQVAENEFFVDSEVLLHRLEELKIKQLEKFSEDSEKNFIR